MIIAATCSGSKRSWVRILPPKACFSILDYKSINPSLLKWYFTMPKECENKILPMPLCHVLANMAFSSSPVCLPRRVEIVPVKEVPGLMVEHDVSSD